MKDTKVNLEYLLYGYYIKYNRLDYLSQYIKSDTRRIDVYIDLYKLLRRIYSTEFTANKSFVITSAVINMISHIRTYYKTRFGKWTRVYLVYADESGGYNSSFCPEFGSNTIEQTYNYDVVSSLIFHQLDLVKILVAYIQDAYYIYRRNNFSMFVYDNISRNSRTGNVASIIISSSKYVYQVPAMLYYSNMDEKIFLFHPKKSKDEDKSLLITPSTALLEYFDKVNDNSKNKLRLLSPQLMSLLMTLNGCNDKNIPCIKNSTSSINIIANAIANNNITNSYMQDIDFVLNALGIFKETDPLYDNYVNRFKAMDLLFQYRLYLQSIEYNDITWNINLNDPNTVMQINDKYFRGCPLDLVNLL